ncbi:MAG: tetratricopeptide repeat protein [Planctomycetota bacterium]
MNRTTRFAAVLTSAAGLALVGCSGPQATDSFADGSGRNPTARTLHTMARVLIEQSKPEQAEYVLENLIAQNPGYTPAYVELAELQARRMRENDAERTLEGALEINPDDPIVLNNLGVIRLQKGKIDQAAMAFEAAVRSEPNEARYIGNLALTFALQGQGDEAVALYERVLPAAEARWNVAAALESVGEYEDAALQYAMAQELDRTLGDGTESERALSRMADKFALPITSVIEN